MSTQLIQNQLGFDLLFENPVGGTADELEKIADDLVQQAIDNVDEDYVRRGGGNSGPYPKKRSGHLQDSIKRTEARMEGGQLTVVISADAVHRGEPYWPILRDRWGLHLLQETQ